MTRCSHPFAAFGFLRVRPTLLAIAVLAVANFVAPPASAYVLSGGRWAEGREVVLHLGLGNAPRVLLDGNTSWDAAVAPVVELWNRDVGRVHLSTVKGPTSGSVMGDGVNSVVFGVSAYGNSFGTSTLALTFVQSSGGVIRETDVIVNQAQVFDSYSGPLRFPPHGYAIADMQRVLLHEFGHALGLNHPDQAGQRLDAVMNSMISNLDVPASDDIAGAQALYGKPQAPTPTPTPVPTATPTPTPLPTATPTPTPAAASHLANISTRMRVGASENVLIGGFIISGAQPKKLILRALGPSLSASGISGSMSDPMLELYDSAGKLLGTNDDWQTSTQTAEIAATGVAPNARAESALITTLPSGSYTAVVHGRDGVQGIALVEAYELDSTATRLVNISTRGRISVGEEALIGGLIVQGNANKKVLVRALGPSLGAGGIAGALSNPALELRDASGNLLGSNDDWRTSNQASEIIATGAPPSDEKESAMIINLEPGSYTAVVRGASNGTGVGMVELYDLQP